MSAALVRDAVVRLARLRQRLDAARQAYPPDAEGVGDGAFDGGVLVDSTDVGTTSLESGSGES